MKLTLFAFFALKKSIFYKKMPHLFIKYDQELNKGEKI